MPGRTSIHSACAECSSTMSRNWTVAQIAIAERMGIVSGGGRGWPVGSPHCDALSLSAMPGLRRFCGKTRFFASITIQTAIDGLEGKFGRGSAERRSSRVCPSMRLIVTIACAEDARRANRIFATGQFASFPHNPSGAAVPANGSVRPDSPHEAQRVSFASPKAAPDANRRRAEREFFNEIDVNRTFQIATKQVAVGETAWSK